MNRKVLFVMRLLGVLLFVMILFYVDLKEMADGIKKAKIDLLVLAFILLIPLYFIKALRWKGILHEQKVFYPFSTSLLAYLSSNFIAFITPGRLGEVAKALYIKQDTGLGLVKTIPSVILDRVFDVYFLTIVGSIGMLHLSIFMKVGIVGYVVLGLIALSPMLFIYSSFRLVCEKKVRKMNLFRKWDEKVEVFFDGFHCLNFRNFFYSFFLTALAYGVLFFSSTLIAMASGVQVGFLKISFFVSIANILSFIPISIAGFGTREASFMFLFSTVGRQKEEALAFSLLFFLVFYIGGGLIGFLAYTIKPIDFHSLKKGFK